MSFTNSASLGIAALQGKDNIYLELICKLHFSLRSGTKTVILFFQAVTQTL